MSTTGDSTIGTPRARISRAITPFTCRTKAGSQEDASAIDWGKLVAPTAA